MVQSSPSRRRANQDHTQSQNKAGKSFSFSCHPLKLAEKQFVHNYFDTKKCLLDAVDAA
jgi:hypothetical protein